jgi:hypothetical protein
LFLSTSIQFCLNIKSFIIAELRKLCQCVVLVEEVSLCMEYFMAQEHAQVRYNIADVAHLHILIKKICPFLLIFTMLMQKKHNSVINNEQAWSKSIKGIFTRTQWYLLECKDITRKIKKLKDTMITYMLTIDSILSCDP